MPAKGDTYTAFSAFCAFYMVSFVLDRTKNWDDPFAAVGAILATTVVHRWVPGRRSFVLFLIAANAYLLAYHFPDVGNHSNVFLLCSLFLIAAIVQLGIGSSKPPDDAALFAALAVPLRATLAIVYFSAGFHKLNTDFFHPEVSCAGEFFSGMLTVLFLPDVLTAEAIPAVAVLVLGWELLGGLMLWVRRFQLPVLAVSVVVHSILAHMTFIDFSSLAFALMLTFVPPAQWDLLRADRSISIGRFKATRLDAYVYLNLAMAAAAGLVVHLAEKPAWLQRAQGMALDLAMLVFIWPLIAHWARSSHRVPWQGMRLWTRQVPAAWALLPIAAVLWALNPYLGLRTTGTFTMFSNLRTEGETSNHLILKSNPLKIWRYQEDVVEVIALDDRHAAHPRHALPGYRIPVVEFKKRIHAWRRQRLDRLHAMYTYDGRVYETDDIIRDNPWAVDGRDLEMYLMDFRVIQRSGPTRCRW